MNWGIIAQIAVIVGSAALLIIVTLGGGSRPANAPDPEEWGNRNSW
jgi:hypothetical protein